MTPAERGRPRNADHDVAILDAAMALLVEHGPDAASVEAIARRAGVAKLTVYRRWKSKDELLIAAIDRIRSPAPEPFDAEASLDDAVRAIAAQLSRPQFRHLAARMVGATVDRPDLVRAYTRRHLQPRLDGLRRVVERAAAAGEFPAGCDPEIICDALFGTVISALYRPAPTQDDLEALLHRLVRQLGYRATADRS